MELLLSALPFIKWTAGLASIAFFVWLLISKTVSDRRRNVLRVCGYGSLALFCLLSSYQYGWLIWPLMCAVCAVLLAIIASVQAKYR